MPTVTGRATDFITFSRTSNATVTGADGRIRWAGHNLLTNSESFDAAAYSKTNVTVTANNTVAPNGTTTADKVEVTATAATVMFQATSAVNGPCTFSIWVKKGNIANRMNVFLVRNSTTATNLLGITINYDTGAFVYDVGSSGALVENAGSGWWKITMTVTSGVNLSDTMLFYTGASGGSYIAGDHVFFWGAHVFRSDLGSMVLNPARGDAYYPTTVRNIYGYTEAFSDAYWSKNSATIVPNSLTAPNGLATADTLLATAGTAVRPYVAPSIHTGVLSTPLVASIYAKQGTARYLQIWNSAGATSWHVNFDLQTGTKGSESNCTGAIQSVGNGWYRCSVAYSPSLAANITTVFQIVTSSTSARAEQWDPVGTESIYLWGAQLSDSASLDAYSPVYGAAVTSAAYYAPRLDFDPVTLAARGLLVEEQRTNVLLHTAAFDNASWDKVAVGTASAPVVTANNATAPDGTLTADLVFFDRGAGTSGDRSVLSQAPSLSAGTYTQSVWLKAATAGDIGKQLALRNVAGGTYLVVTLTASWVRYERTEVWAANNWEITNRQGITADTTVSAHVWGAQLEAGSFATSYIPNGSAVAGATRTADVASVSTQAFPYSSTAGSVVVAYDRIGVNRYSRLFNLGDASENNQVSLLNFNVGQENAYFVTGGVAAAVVTGPSVPAVNAASKMGLAFKSGDSAISLNGASATAISSTFTPAATSLYMGGTPVSGQYLNGHVRQITYIPRRLSNSELQARTV